MIAPPNDFSRCIRLCNLTKTIVDKLRRRKSNIDPEYLWNDIVCYFAREGSLFIRTNCVWNDDDTALTGDGYNFKNGFDDVWVGDCISKSCELYLKMRKLEGVKLIQGECWSRTGDYKPYNKFKGIPIFHSWVEWKGKVYDYSQNKRIVADWDIFYATMRIKKTIEVVPEIENDKLVETKFRAYSIEKGRYRRGKYEERPVLSEWTTYLGTGEQQKKIQELVGDIKRKQRSVGVWTKW